MNYLNMPADWCHKRAPGQADLTPMVTKEQLASLPADTNKNDLIEAVQRLTSLNREEAELAVWFVQRHSKDRPIKVAAECCQNVLNRTINAIR